MPLLAREQVGYHPRVVIQVLSPTGRLHARRADRAVRPRSLDGLRLHTIELGFKNAPVFLDRITERLRADFRLAALVRHPKPKFTEGFPEEELRLVARDADVVVSAFGH